MHHTLFDLVGEAFVLVAICGALPLVVAFLVSSVVGLAQAAAQIQDEAGARVVRMVAVVAALVVAAPLIAARFAGFAGAVFGAMEALQ